ncbi:ion channel [Streptomyces oceani]|uniref:Ion transporter n=1 Tax=Streptomyces oceani TaxID=1075402 RepID=A0A1E7JWL3_9ACTN|nr:ion channel [Streptomyces oceani]OEU96054.1 ion transporter [Streptomyces oceani]
MPFIMARLAQVLRARVRGWRAALAVGFLVFATSWFAMWLVEPDNKITEPQNYWWWFLVTAATVGYGDHYPETGLGHAVGGYVIVGGIVALTILFTQLAATIQAAKGKRMKGAVDLDLGGHIVILGYTSGRTEGIVAELRLEDQADMVLCAWDEVVEHPMPERDGVLFVRGDLTDVDVLTRACVHRAATVLIDARDDNEALALAVAVHHLAPEVHLVAALRDMSRTRHVRYVSPEAQCVQWHMPGLLTEETLDPGITEVYADLMSGTGGGNTYSMKLPTTLTGKPFGDCQTRLGREFGATVIAIRQDGDLVVGPTWEKPLRAGALLYYVANRRIEDHSLR